MLGRRMISRASRVKAMAEFSRCRGDLRLTFSGSGFVFMLNFLRMAVNGGPLGVTREMVLARLNDERRFCCSWITCLNFCWKKCLRL